MVHDSLISVVAPVFNEESCLEEFHNRLSVTLKKHQIRAEVIFVNDGSSDSSLEIIKKIRTYDSAVKVLDFSRNFGHQVAIKAGVDHAQGDAVIVMDTDLQDPPELIPEFIAKWREGYDVVYAVRKGREGEGFLKKWTSSAYYKLIKKLARVEMPLDAGDFRLISRRVADIIKTIKEKNPYLRGLVSWVGFRQAGILIYRQARFAGETKYTLLKMLALAWNGITHFSFLPLQISTVLGVAVSVICVLWMFQALYVKLVLGISVPGWASLMVAVLFLGSMQLIMLGILGSYLARNFDEARNRPLYIVQSKEGF